MFKKAVKYDAKARVSIIAPSGGGKSKTALILARALAGPNGRIAAIDTEHGSLSKYADEHQFDVLELSSFSPDNFIHALDAAEAEKYEVFIVDSLSHFWIGKDGALEFVDLASKHHRDQMGGWKEFRPHERAMVDRMVASPCHIITTMRSKTAYEEQVDERTGKKKRVKIGLAPVQREGLEYEFDLVGYMDPDDNSFAIDKTRCSLYAQKVMVKPTAKDFQPFIDWLAGAKREPDAPKKLTQEQITQLTSVITTAQDINSMRTAFQAAYRAARNIGDAEAMQAFEKAKDDRKAQLPQKPATNGAAPTQAAVMR